MLTLFFLHRLRRRHRRARRVPRARLHAQGVWALHGCKVQGEYVSAGAAVGAHAVEYGGGEGEEGAY